MLSAAFLASCSSVQKVTELDIPVLSSLVSMQLINPAEFTEPTEELLESEGLLQGYRRNPSDVVVELRRMLSKNPAAELQLALIEVCSDTGERLASSEPMIAVGYHMAAAEVALPGALKDSNTESHKTMLEAYNFSCGRVAKILFNNDHDWNKTIEIEGPGQKYQLRCRTTGKGFVDPDYFDDLWATQNLEFEGLDHLKRNIRPGFGEMMVGHRDFKKERLKKEPMLGIVGMSIPVTATLESVGKGGVMELSIYDNLIMDEARLAGEKVTLSADYTAPLALLYNYKTKGNIGAKGLLHPDRHIERRGLVLFEPFRNDQIPVIFVHGLASSPATWGAAVNVLRNDPILRKKYQLLAYYYPTGFPVIYNSSGLRMHLQKLQNIYNPGGANPAMKNMLIVGHSMGGILSNAQIRGSGNTLTEKIFTVPIDEVDGLNSTQKQMLKEMLLYEADPNITRAVFVASPHRGSDIASNRIGDLAKRLIKYPIEAVTSGINFGAGIKSGDLTEFGAEAVTEGSSSIDSLEPGNPGAVSILEQDVRQGVVIHSIIAQANPEDTLLEGSDKVVSYQSAHLDRAASEKVVNATHTTINGNPEAIEEMRRILYLHAGLSYTRTPDEILNEILKAPAPRRKAASYGHRNRR